MSLILLDSAYCCIVGVLEISIRYHGMEWRFFFFFSLSLQLKPEYIDLCRINTSALSFRIPVQIINFYATLPIKNLIKVQVEKEDF